MADNVNYPSPTAPPSGYANVVVGLDVCVVNGVAGVGVPLGKLGYGGNDAFTYVSLTAGLPVQPQTGATWAVSAAALPLPAGAATEATLSTASGSLTTLSGKLPSSLGIKTAANSLSVAPASDATFALAAGANTVGNVGQVATAAGGWAPALVNSAASTNATSVKASAGQVGVIALTNSGAGWAYLKLYNKASAPTVGSDTPVHVVGLPPGGGQAQAIPAGLSFSLGIAYAITGGAANSDTTAVAANQVVGTLGTA